MAQGFVYILLNPDFPNLIKIGMTNKSTEERAKSLRTTGVPSPFIVIYEELVSDAKKVERKLHELFAEYRKSDREFFHVPVKQAIKALQKEAKNFSVELSDFQKVEVLPQLKKKFGKEICKHLLSVLIIQSSEICYAEIKLKCFSEMIQRTDLDFFYGDEFSPTNPIKINAKKFVALDERSLQLVSDYLFIKSSPIYKSSEWLDFASA